MIDANDLAVAFARNAQIVRMQADGLSQADSLRTTPSGGNCLNWALGHIAVSRDDILEMLGEARQIGAAGACYKRESTRLAESDALPFEELLGWIDRAQERIAAALARTTPVDLAREITNSRGRTSTVGQRVFFAYFHETFHVGQTELYRQLAGKTDKLI